MTENITAVPPQKPIEIIVIADRSGSMGSILDESIGAFNAFIEEQQKQEGEANLTVALFDHHYEVMQESVNLKEAVRFDKTNFVPRGYTALYDAIGRTLSKEMKRREANEIDGAIVVIITDGAENASREFSTDTIKTLIKKCEDEYKWEFVFLAANQDAFSTGASFGLAAASANNFTADAKGLLGATQVMNSRSTSYRSAYYNPKTEADSE